MAVYNAKVKCGSCRVTYGFKLVKSPRNLSKWSKENPVLSWRFGVKPVGAMGESFDSEKHEALSQAESEQEPDRVISELEKGYLFHERLLRPIKVLVSKARPEKIT